ncbi:MAG: SHOCT domain-containing protein [Defluviitaleaceae bacterium]|nr:SHOCT domain-containing protein [Defluviitaleaceae bacterium]
MAKKLCGVCDAKLGMFSTKHEIKDGVVCGDCVNLSKLDAATLKGYDTPALAAHIAAVAPDVAAYKKKEKAFTATKSVEKYLLVDSNNKLFRVGKDGFIFDFADLFSFELLEDGESLLKSGAGMALAGGMVAGSSGALLGAVLGKSTKSVCNTMNIVITVKNCPVDTHYIKFIGGILNNEIPKNSIIYKHAQDMAQQCLSALRLIVDENDTSAASEPAPALVVAAELQKFHDLKEKGVISEADFDAKKAQLLGL